MDNPDPLCAVCSRKQSAELREPPDVPREFWNHPDVRAALRDRHLGRLFRAFRLHPWHAKPISQEVMARWFGVTQPTWSRTERTSLSHLSLDKLIWHARTLRIPAELLWFDPRSHQAGPQASDDIAPAGSESLEGHVAGPMPSLIVLHEHAELRYHGGIYHSLIRRELSNTGSEPVTRYLIRISVDRFPGDSARSNELYRQRPLTWAELGLKAHCNDEPMEWDIKQDRDAFKEVWLKFENGNAHFPLYPGERRTITYSYTVGDDKWGSWWQRAIRIPTHRLSLVLEFPSDLDPAIWGVESSMSTGSSSFRTPLLRHENNDIVRFSWSSDDPPLHARYRVEWKLSTPAVEDHAGVGRSSPAEAMRSLGIAQYGEPILQEPTHPFALPADSADARWIVAQLTAMLERLGRVHKFAKGMGLAAPQLGIARSAAVVRAPDGGTITLLNPRVVDTSLETDQQYEGCLSFFDVRGQVRRPLRVSVEHETIGGRRQITEFEDALARLVSHEVDHLNGVLYRDLMPPDGTLIPISQYTGSGQSWIYLHDS